MIEYTQGVCEDGAAILENGQPITPEQIVDLLNGSTVAYELNCRLSKILTDTANVLKGEPEKLQAHSWRDLAEVARSELARRDKRIAGLCEVLSELEESSAYWSEYDVPLGIVDRIKIALDSDLGDI